MQNSHQHNTHQHIKNQSIVITGGTSGIGRSMVHQLAIQNRVTVIARPSARLDKLKRDMPCVVCLEADLSDPASLDRAADALTQHGIPIDLLINNAAVQYTPGFLDDDFRYETIQREVTINFTSICVLIHLLLPSLIKDSPSTILNINSGLALVPKRDSAVYCGTKGALNAFSTSLRHQLESTNVSVKQAFLPLIDTPMTQGRGSGKLTSQDAAQRILSALSSDRHTIDVGKVGLLRQLDRFAPSVATQLMKAG